MFEYRRGELEDGYHERVIDALGLRKIGMFNVIMRILIGICGIFGDCFNEFFPFHMVFVYFTLIALYRKFSAAKIAKGNFCECDLNLL